MNAHASVLGALNGVLEDISFRMTVLERERDRVQTAIGVIMEICEPQPLPAAQTGEAVQASVSPASVSAAPATNPAYPTAAQAKHAAEASTETDAGGVQGRCEPTPPTIPVPPVAPDQHAGANAEAAANQPPAGEGGQQPRHEPSPAPILAPEKPKQPSGTRFYLRSADGLYLHMSGEKMIAQRQYAWSGTAKQMAACREKFELAKDLKDLPVSQDAARK